MSPINMVRLKSCPDDINGSKMTQNTKSAKMGVQEMDPLCQLSLPPGFRFYPTDEELMVNYLCQKVAGHNFPLKIIGDIDLYKFDPWVLPSKALFGEKEWYFFSPRDRKYPNGSRPNRVAGSGYWKATGTDKVITSEGRKVGIKKALVFYIGKAPKGSKTNWIMHEYRLLEAQRKIGSSKLDDWVLCRIYKKNSSAQKAELGMSKTECSHGSSSSSSSQFDESLPAIDHRNDKPANQNLGYFGNNFDWATLGGLNNLLPQQFGTGTQLVPMQIQTQGVMNTINNNYDQNDMFIPSVSYGRIIEQEVQSGMKNQQIDNSGFLNPNGYAPGFINSVDPYATTYPTQFGNSGRV